MESAESALSAMGELLAHRGPDDSGEWVAPGACAGLAHRRLSIIDLSAAGSQPMEGSNDTVVVLNGEIYNYLELRDSLSSHWSFRSQSDTETILAAHDRFGDDCFSHFRGMFAFALWDQKKRRLVCGRDRFGIKPFYYTVADDVFYFASEPKALLPFVPAIETDPDAMAEYLTFNYVIGEATLFKGIRQLLPGHALVVENGEIRIRRYWDVNYEVDWDSNFGWEYRNNALHHDFVRLASGNTLVLLWEKLTQEETNKITGGIFRDSDPDQMMADVIAEIGPQGQVIKKWYVKEFLDFEKDVICPLEGRHGWTHGNSLDVMPNGDILVSFRQINVIAIVDQSSGVAKWKWGSGDISHQHDATHVGNGNVMVFDNGSHRFGVSYSRVLEINPVSNTIVWEYRGSPPIAFYSFNLGSAQRLPNGNTLICEGAPGRLIEVTKMGEIVWEYISPFTVVSRTGTFTNAIFKAFRYAFAHAGFVGKNLDPVQYDGLNRMLN